MNTPILDLANDTYEKKELALEDLRKKCECDDIAAIHSNWGCLAQKFDRNNRISPCRCKMTQNDVIFKQEKQEPKNKGPRWLRAILRLR